MKTVRAYTIKGFLLCKIIQLLCIPLYLIKGKKWLRSREFEENPRTMGFKDILYFAYKYYFKSPVLPSSDKVIKHFEDSPTHIGPSKVLATISLGGDLMPYELINIETTERLWENVGHDFFSSDIVFANLETPLDFNADPSFVPEVMLTDMLFNTDKQTLRIFSGNGSYKGYSILSVANNHTMDQGIRGIDNTIEHLNFNGIRTVGAITDHYENMHEVIEVNGIKVGFMAITYSLNQFLMPDELYWKVNHMPLNIENCPLDLLYEQVQKCRKSGAEFIILSLHCGNAYQAYPSAVTVQLYERIFNALGIDVIVGTHPHNLQPWRTYNYQDPFTGKSKQGFAIYSLGDFVAYDIFTWSHLSAYLKLEIGRNSDGDIVFKPNVVPMVMLKENKKLKLHFADKIFNKENLNNELKDMKVLYDICTKSNKN